MARSSSRQARTYPSKIDLWLVGVLVVAMTAAFAGVAAAGFENGVLRAAQGGFILLGVAGFIAWIWLSTNYTLDGPELIVRSGPFSWRIPLAEIDAVEKPTGFVRSGSSPALSMDRLLVRYGKGKKLMISPAEKQAFLKDLAARGVKL